MFDPNQHQPDDSSGGQYLDVSGTFCLVFTSLHERGTNRNGKDYLQFRGKVICGEPTGNDGKKFTERVFITESAYKRLGAMCASMGVNEPFDLYDDEQVRRNMCNAPFKAKVQTETHNGKTYPGIAYSEQQYEDWERDACDRWTAEHQAAGGYDDEDNSGGSGSYDEAPPHTDDDDQSGSSGGGFDDDIHF